MARRRRVEAADPIGTEVENAVKAAHLGWGRLEPPNLAQAVVLHVLRITQEPMNLEEITLHVRQLSSEEGFFFFDNKRWLMEARLDSLRELSLVKRLPSHVYALTTKAIEMYGDDNLHPARGPRHPADLPIFRDCTEDR